MPRILGLDPGLGTTGWAIIRADGNRLGHIANGQFKTDAAFPLPQRLARLAEQLEAMIAEHAPEAAAVEEVFVNQNPQSTLKLGWKPSTEVEVRGDDAGTLMKLIDTLEDDDDVQTVWGNYNVPDEELEKLA